MNRGYRYTLRLGQRAHLRCRLTLGVVASFAACALAAVSWPASGPIHLASLSEPAVLAAAAAPVDNRTPRPARIVYPYSVVPGGVASQAELLRIVRSDKVVAAHYAGFDVAGARPVKVGAPRAVHVSYRKGDHIYWTAKKVMLRPGETLFTDGRNEMRARCANRISEVARFPVEAHEPDLALLDASFEQGLEDADGALVSVAAPGLGDGAAYTASAGTAFPSAETARSSQAGTARTPPDAGGLALAPRIGDLHDTGFVSTGWDDRLAGGVSRSAAPAPARSAAPPLLVALDSLPQGEQGVQGVQIQRPDPAPFIPAVDPSRPPRPDSTLADARNPAEVPEPGTGLLLAAALTALLALHRKD